MTAPSARYRCFAGCASRFSLAEVRYTCDCGELLEVEHDVPALRERTATQWRSLFAERAARFDAPYGSGVWAKREWVMPFVRDEHVTTMLEGRNPLVRADRYASAIGAGEVYVKQCGSGPTGSFKDLGMTVLVSVVRQLVADGAPIRAVACASTGDTSAALAAYCAAAGLRSVVLLPRGKVTTAQLVQPLSHGATVLEIDTDFDGCMRHVKRLAAEPGIYLANSMNSLRLEGQKTVAIEMAEQLGWSVPDWVIIPGGNLGNVSALGAGFDLMIELGLIAKRPRVCVAQAAAASPLYEAFVKGFDRFEPVVATATEASAIRIGDPVSVRRAIRVLRACDGVVERANEEELAEAAARADRTGLYADPHTGVALAALEKLVKAGTIKKTERVVVVSTASALKFTEFKVRYHEGRIEGATSRNAVRTTQVADDYAAVVRAALA